MWFFLAVSLGGRKFVFYWKILLFISSCKGLNSALEFSLSVNCLLKGTQLPLNPAPFSARSLQSLILFFLLWHYLCKQRGLFRTRVYLPVLQDLYQASSLRTCAGELVDKNQHYRLKVLEVKGGAERKMELYRVQQRSVASAVFPSDVSSISMCFCCDLRARFGLWLCLSPFLVLPLLTEGEGPTTLVCCML